MGSFDAVVDEYDAARPAYPDEVYDALEAAAGPLLGALVMEGGGGTGIATRGLRERGARVIAVDVGAAMLRRNDGARVLADAARAPFRARVADLACFAQCWHWLDESARSAEVARLLRPHGWWAGWWNHPRADGEPWFEAYFDVLEASTAAERAHRDIDWGATLDQALFEPPVFVAVPWLREVPLATWLTDQRSHSYIGLEPSGRRVIADLEAILRDEFGDGPVRVRYETWLWVARRRA